MAAPMPEPAFVRAADLVILFYIYGLHSCQPAVSSAQPRTPQQQNGEWTYAKSYATPGDQTKRFQPALIVESSNIGNFISRRRKCEGVAQPVGEHRSIRCHQHLLCNLEIEQRN